MLESGTEKEYGCNEDNRPSHFLPFDTMTPRTEPVMLWRLSDLCGAL